MTAAFAQQFQDAGDEFVLNLSPVLSLMPGPCHCKTRYLRARSSPRVHQDVTTKASQLKELGKTFVLSMVRTVVQRLVIADKCGLETDALHDFFDAIFPGPYVANSNRNYHERAESLFTVILLKHARRALYMISKSGAAMKSVELADAYMALVKEHMGAGALSDLKRVYFAIRESGVDSYCHELRRKLHILRVAGFLT
ncbi:uncharacterized protein N7443_009129 [Penicillium atrosanguineum]|uniref:uncharacterized protein n=1 Tax=Penicillium atrosanguineum TaxID=1132637 RepID=UPI00239590ED|nr:uncharacterized protein N7443_009129 [Penicillium atrosanguineum]KAJ5293176.1 hypothetical protein N7443_009129 [Penicillium atrosanguineum]